MSKVSFCFLALVVLTLLSGCKGDTCPNKALLGQKLSLAIGQCVSMRNEKLEIKFLDVVEDNRCPRDATCTWEGRVSCLVQITDNGSSESILLIQPGLADQDIEETYKEYLLTFHIEPYPKVGKKISPGEYRLLFSINKMDD